MNLRISAPIERIRSSLFFVPMIAVIAAAALGFAVLAVDRHIDTTLAELPFGFTSTVESARTLLGVIAGATISFAGIAFSVSLLSSNSLRANTRLASSTPCFATRSTNE